jgi:hypothetical protein
VAAALEAAGAPALAPVRAALVPAPGAADKEIERMRRLFGILIAACILLITPSSGLAQTYIFQLQEQVVNVFWNADGSQSIDYVFVFKNDAYGPPIEFVDVGIPNENYNPDYVYADIDGEAAANIEESPYVTPGVAVDLGAKAIPAGETGRVHVFIGIVEKVLYPDSSDENYVSAVFAPNYFSSESVRGTTDMTVSFHLPPGVQPEEPRWHMTSDGWPEEPQTGFDQDGRITYTWRNPQASGSSFTSFGASFPAAYVPEYAIVRPEPFNFWKAAGEFVSGVSKWLLSVLTPLAGLYVLARLIGYSGKRRKLQYLPPKISIEGHGIKRGLTAVEAAILMEQPLDKILTMILFAVVKKGGAKVISKDPLELETIEPQPKGLHVYEQDFLRAFESKKVSTRRKVLQKMVVDLVDSLSHKMKGFSRKETVAYYREIMDKAWTQVEAAGTPEVKSQKFDEVMEWTMLDRNYDRRTRETFSGGPVFVPIWWSSYDPGFKPSSTTTATTTSGRSSGTSPSNTALPHLPGATFAASMVNSVQSFSAGVIGDVTEFTGRITQRTNPAPKSSGGSHRSGGGSSGGSSCACACACACAGCACACAGGGR